MEKIGSMTEVVGLGQCSLDYLGRVPVYPDADQKVEIREFLVQGGGPVATALVTLACLGVRTAFAGRVGDDDLGAKIRQGLTAEGIDCRALLSDPDATSQFAFIAVEQETARRTIFWSRGSAQPLGADQIPRDLILSARILHLDGLQQEASLAAARFAREKGIITVLDGGTWREGTDRLLPHIDHLVVSDTFARHLAGDPLKALKPLLEYGPRAVTVTTGEGGSHTLTPDGTLFHQPAFAVDAVDTTGCGDVFHGGYIYGLLHRWDLRRTVRFAAACAALKTRALGGRTALANLGEVEAFLGGTGGEKTSFIQPPFPEV